MRLRGQGRRPGPPTLETAERPLGSVAVSPSILFGSIDTDRFRRMHPGWVIKKVNANEEIEFINHVAAYMMASVGFEIVERDVSEVYNDFRLLCRMLSGLGDDGTLERGRCSDSS